MHGLQGRKRQMLLLRQPSQAKHLATIWSQSKRPLLLWAKKLFWNSPWGANGCKAWGRKCQEIRSTIVYGLWHRARKLRHKSFIQDENDKETPDQSRSLQKWKKSHKRHRSIWSVWRPIFVQCPYNDLHSQRVKLCGKPIRFPPFLILKNSFKFPEEGHSYRTLSNKTGNLAPNSLLLHTICSKFQEPTTSLLQNQTLC